MKWLKHLAAKREKGSDRQPQPEGLRTVSFWYPNPKSGIEPLTLCDCRIAGDYLEGTPPGESHPRDFYIPSITRPDYSLAKALKDHPKANKGLSKAYAAGRAKDPSRLP